MSKILIVEDESKIARFLELELKHEGYEVEVAGDGRIGLEKALNNNVDMVLLDIMLPSISGIEVCRRIRQQSEMPIIMLTAKDDVTDKVAGLDSGADDYMTKPFAIEELLARIRVALKRTTNKEKDEEVKSETLSYDKLVLNELSREVTYDGEEIVLTKKEYDLLAFLLENANVALSRDKLLNEVWEYDYMGDTNVVDVYVRYLRQKIDEKYGIHMIETVRGVGYMIKK